MEKNSDVLDAQEAAIFLGAHRETIRRLARKGEIPAYKVGKDWRFRREKLLQWSLYKMSIRWGGAASNVMPREQ